MAPDINKRARIKASGTAIVIGMDDAPLSVAVRLPASDLIILSLTHCPLSSGECWLASGASDLCCVRV